MELPILYQKTATGSVNYWKVWTERDEVCTEWGQFGTDSPQRQSYVAKPTNVGRKNERDASAQAEFEAKAMWTKKKRVKYFESVNDAETKLNLKPMLAQEYEARLASGKIVFPVVVQPKLNGYRALAYRKEGEVPIQSRGGKFYGMKHVADALKLLLPAGDMNLLTDGELYHHGMSLQRLGSLIKKPRYPESEQIEYHIYDSTYVGRADIWSNRWPMLDLLAKTWAGVSPYIRFVDSVIANSDREVRVMHNAFVADGYEGAIIRTMDHEYRFGYRSPGLLKLKEMEDKEFPITGWTVGKDDVPMWMVRLENGREMPVRPLGTAEERAEMLQNADQQVGRLLKVRFQDRTDDGMLSMARGIEIRDEADL